MWPLWRDGPPDVHRVEGTTGPCWLLGGGQTPGAQVQQGRLGRSPCGSVTSIPRLPVLPTPVFFPFSEVFVLTP